ncbi:GNAT family N-acetyltransferase [Chitinivorax sp. B]|uniref:GNAT family N-acetyltransferase n=1 Tax=Chitinivorax sp. B TaxID=2502235 RepID=UPI0014858CE3|nr:GNAT family N-acetyltransferase [Chitinivorax sp. B]
MLTTALSLDPLTPTDFTTVAQLGDIIWRAHYSALISMEQIEYMLAGRYTADKLQAYVNADDRWLKVLKIEGRPVGYLSYALTTTPGEMKLEQLYLLPELHGQGLGRCMLDEVETAARNQGCHLLMLTVNKHNNNSIAVYRKRGFSVRTEAVFDIGNGFVMDDYVMEKKLDA